MVETFGINLESLGIPRKVPSDFYIHLFHFLILLILSGQLYAAPSRQSAPYLSWALRTALTLSIAYFLYTLSALFPQSYNQDGLPQFSPPSREVLWLLSLTSSITLLLSGLTARYRFTETYTQTRIILTSSIIVGGTTFLIKLFTILELHSSAPIAACSITACTVCAFNYFRRAKACGALLPITLFSAFLSYGMVHLLEPLLYATGFPKKELIFLLSFITKSVVFLSIVSLALVESDTFLRNSNARLTLLNLELQRQQENYSRILSRTGSAYFQDSPEGHILLSLGEEEILGARLTETVKRVDFFADEHAYTRLITDLHSSREVVEKVVELRHSDGTKRFVNLRAKLEDQEGKRFIQGLYHDVTKSEHLKAARSAFDRLAVEVTATSSVEGALRCTRDFLEETLQAEVQVYLSTPREGPTPPLRFLATSYSLDDSSNDWPLFLGDAILNVFSEGRLLLLHAKYTGNLEHLRAVFSVQANQTLAVVSLQTTALQSSRHELDRIRGFVAVALDGVPSIVQESYLQVLEEVSDQLFLGIELILMQKITSDLEAVWRSFSTQGPMRRRLESSLQAIADPRYFDHIFLMITYTSTGSATAEDPIAISPKGDLDPYVTEVRNQLQEDFQNVLPAEPRYYVRADPISEGAQVAWALIPLSTAESGPIGALMAGRNTNPGPQPSFNHFDERYLRHLANQFATVIARSEADQSFRFVVGQISHDLKAPINAIKNRAHYLITRLNQTNRHVLIEKLKDIKNNAFELSALAGRIDHFKRRPEVPRLTLVFKDVIQKNCKELGHMFKERGVSLPDVHFSNFDMIPPILCRRSALDRVVQNIIINFAKYGRDEQNHRSPRFSGAADDEFFIIKFENWGPPISEKEKDLIFRAGYRGEFYRRRKVTGEGMGLFIARDLAENELQGRLVLASTADPVEFRLFLPRNLTETGEFENV